MRILSLHDLVPNEPGGEENRRGILFQDHIAAGFYLEMLENEALTTVWCEAEDDITLVWERECGTEGEFVQVKSDELDQLWSVARLCRRDGGREGTSILERSLQREKYIEPCWFRIVTARPVNNDLECLELPLAHAERQLGSASLEQFPYGFRANSRSGETSPAHPPR